MLESVFTLMNKKILITGASSGLGRVIAIEASRAGATVDITGRNQERLNQTFSQLDTSQGQEHRSFVFDLTDLNKIGQIDFSNSSYDGIVLAAGINKIIPFTFLTSEVIENVMHSNFTGNVLLLQRVIREKIFHKKGAVVFVSSINGTNVGSKGHTVYAASKGAINGIMRTLANELSRFSIRVNAVSPGLIDSGMIDQNSEILSQDGFKDYMKKYPLGIGKPEDVAYCCIYLLSDASRWITGQALVIDGGLSINN